MSTGYSSIDAMPDYPPILCYVCGEELCATEEIVARVQAGERPYCSEDGTYCGKACGHSDHAYNPYAERYECCQRRKCECPCRPKEIA